MVKDDSSIKRLVWNIKNKCWDWRTTNVENTNIDRNSISREDNNYNRYNNNNDNLNNNTRLERHGYC